MATTTIKSEVQRLADQLPDDATWDDVLYQIYVRQSVDAGLEDVKAGRVVSINEVRKRIS